MTTHDDFAQMALSKANRGTFRPLANYNPDDDSLEVLIDNESYRTKKSDNDRYVSIYLGRDSGNVIGVLISRVSRLIEDMENDKPDLMVQVHHNGKLKVGHVFRYLREESKKEVTTLAVLIKQLEEKAYENDLEANYCNLAGAS